MAVRMDEGERGQVPGHQQRHACRLAASVVAGAALLVCVATSAGARPAALLESFSTGPDPDAPGGTRYETGGVPAGARTFRGKVPSTAEYGPRQQDFYYRHVYVKTGYPHSHRAGGAFATGADSTNWIAMERFHRAGAEMQGAEAHYAKIDRERAEVQTKIAGLKKEEAGLDMEAAEAHAELMRYAAEQSAALGEMSDAPKIDAMNATTAEEEGGVVEGADEAGEEVGGAAEEEAASGEDESGVQTASGEEEVGEEPLQEEDEADEASPTGDKEDGEDMEGVPGEGAAGSEQEGAGGEAQGSEGSGTEEEGAGGEAAGEGQVAEEGGTVGDGDGAEAEGKGEEGEEGGLEEAAEQARDEDEAAAHSAAGQAEAAAQEKTEMEERFKAVEEQNRDMEHRLDTLEKAVEAQHGAEEPSHKALKVTSLQALTVPKVRGAGRVLKTKDAVGIGRAGRGEGSTGKQGSPQGAVHTFADVRAARKAAAALGQERKIARKIEAQVKGVAKARARPDSLSFLNQFF